MFLRFNITSIVLIFFNLKIFKNIQCDILYRAHHFRKYDKFLSHSNSSTCKYETFFGSPGVPNIGCHTVFQIFNMFS